MILAAPVVFAASCQQDFIRIARCILLEILEPVRILRRICRRCVEVPSPPVARA